MIVPDHLLLLKLLEEGGSYLANRAEPNRLGACLFRRVSFVQIVQLLQNQQVVQLVDKLKVVVV